MCFECSTFITNNCVTRESLVGLFLFIDMSCKEYFSFAIEQRFILYDIYPNLSNLPIIFIQATILAFKCVFWLKCDLYDISFMLSSLFNKDWMVVYMKFSSFRITIVHFYILHEEDPRDYQSWYKYRKIIIVRNYTFTNIANKNNKDL